MKRYKLLLIALLAVLFISNKCFAADGDKFSVTGFRVDSNSLVYMKMLVENASTSDTLTAVESGKTIVTHHNDGYVEITLPGASAGLNFRITAGRGNFAGGIHGRTYIDPQDGDSIIGCTTTDDIGSMAIGDSIYNNSTTGDSVFLLATSDTGWACIDKIGTWTDGGTGP